jgi:hypothetical protein
VASTPMNTANRDGIFFYNLYAVIFIINVCVKNIFFHEIDHQLNDKVFPRLK